MERVMGIEPTYSAWKAAALPLCYTRECVCRKMGGGGFEPPKEVNPTDLQSVPFGRFGIRPELCFRYSCVKERVKEHAMLPPFIALKGKEGSDATCRSRTDDLRFTKPLLYQLS